MYPREVLFDPNTGDSPLYCPSSGYETHPAHGNSPTTLSVEHQDALPAAATATSSTNLQAHEARSSQGTGESVGYWLMDNLTHILDPPLDRWHQPERRYTCLSGRCHLFCFPN
jgi:hypothetical protein